MAAVFVFSSRSWAAMPQQDSAPAMGDIIEYDSAADGVVYGLVMEVNRVLVTVERQREKRGVRRGGGREMEFTIDRVPLKSSNWEVIDSIAARKAEKGSEVRMWRSKDGKSTIEAALVRVEGTDVRLKKKSNGKTIKIPIAKLSDEDQTFIKGDESDDLFAAEEEEDFPEAVLALIERRSLYMQIQKRHDRIARGNNNMFIGDIVFFDRHGKKGLGIVTSLNFGGEVQGVDEDGELESARPIHGNWWLYDRPVRPLKSRTWSSSNGKFTIKAALVDITDNETLVLKTNDGDIKKVPLSKLGDKDQKYVKKNRDKLVKASDTAADPGPGDFDESLQVLFARRAELIDFYEASAVASKDAAKMKSIPLNTKSPEMASSQLQPLTLRNNSFDVSVGLNLADHARISRVSYAEQSGMVAFVASSPFHGAPVLAVVDVNTGDAFVNDNAQQVGDDAEVLTISPSGRTLLVYSEDGFDKQQLEHWQFTDGKLEKLAVVPYKTFHTPKAHMFTDEKGAILNFHGDLVFFDLTERIKPTHIVAGSQMTHGTTMQIANNQNAVFYFSERNSSLHYIDVQQKRCSGGLQFDTSKHAGSPYAQINSDGQTATFLFGRHLAIYDVKSGDVIKQHRMPSHFSRAFFEDDAFPMLSGTLLQTSGNRIFDLKLNAEIGSITGHSHGVQHFSNSSRIVAKVNSDRSEGRGGFSGGGTPGGRRVGSGANDLSPRTVNIKYESLDVDAIQNYADSLTDADIVSFGEGDKVELDLDLGNENMNRRLQNKLSDEMRDAGIEIGAGGDFVLTATYTVGTPETKNFRIIGRFGNPESTRKVTVTPKTCTAKLTYRGTVIWSRTQSVSLGLPWSVEDLDDRVKRSSNLSAANLLDFKYPVDLRVLHPEKVRKFSWR